MFANLMCRLNVFGIASKNFLSFHFAFPQKNFERGRKLKIEE